MASTPTPTPEVVVEPVVQETAEQRYARLYPNQPQVPAAPAAPAPPAAPDLTNELQTIKDTIAQLAQAVAKPAAPAPPEVKLTPWFELLRQGDFEGAEREITNKVRGAVTQEATQKALNDAVEMMKVQLAVDRYLNDLKGQNPDLVDFEPYLTAPVQNRVEQAKNAGKVKNSDDFIREYKAAVDKEVSTMREIMLRQRAQGKGEAQVRQREVLSATPLQPQKVTANQGDQTPNEPPTETMETYFARRRAIEQMRHGMSV